jgi:hypothetical protein
VLRALSQRQHRKLRDIAAELTFCGTVQGLDSCGQEGGSPVAE